MAAASSSKASSSTKRKASAPSATTSSSGGKSKKAKSSAAPTDEASIPLGRALASTEKRVRDGAVRSLTAYLSANGAHTIGALELQKLWKGLFYCFWMSDKSLVQQRLANDLAQLVLVHPSTTAADAEEGEMTERAQAGLKFLEAFWDTLVAEWAGLDKHRIDKFYLLVRRFTASGFQLLAEEKWPRAAVHDFKRILGKFDAGVLSTNNPTVPDSLTYHLSDIYLDELEKVIEALHDADDGEEDDELALVPTLELLMPFVDALATAKSKAMYDRIWSNVFEPLLADTLVASARDEDDVDFDDADEHDEEDDEDAAEQEADETANGTEFHSFADESALAPNDDESEPSLPPSSSDSEDDTDDVRYPLLLALSSVPTPTPSKDVEEEDDLDEADIDVALLLRKAIFQALFAAASRKDATEARRRLLYQLWRDEQDRLNDLQDSDEEDEDEEEEEEDEEE
ncbi:related to RRP1-involved in processing rRNA precursor species to mature rRNAs [Sporisorium reilianum SRZ2]|uniref:Related to RRP1-involved in processing rRNA species to mature rRNAs n=1 Tax=Sporisorium reilianum (strain SRZ2) TaxID=999809 RepID=E6ZRR3_SPORE|nr:related to RRP1-involved in processing rRNA precursor species to mature rRNAs [Sporisorium reilianum SRZ2]